MVFSYVLIGVTVVAILGAVMTFYYSTLLRQEIMKFNSKDLEGIKETIVKEVVNRSEQIYVDIVTEKYPDVLLIDSNGTPLFPTQISEINRNLNKISAYNGELVDTVDILYNKKELLISGVYGFSRVDINNTGLEYVEKLKNSKEGIIWDSSSDPDYCIYARTYPSFSEFDSTYATIIVKIKKSFISQTLLQSGNDSQKFIIDENGDVVCGSSDDESLTEAIKSGLNNDKTDYIIKTDNDKKTVNSSEISENHWKVIKILPTSVFYRDVINANLILVAFCLIALIIVVLMARKIPLIIYKPLLKILGTIKRDSHTFVINEYEMIQTEIESMHKQINEMSSVQNENLSILTYNLINRLVNNNVQDELAKLLKLLKLEEEYSSYRVFEVVGNKNTLHQSKVVKNDYFIFTSEIGNGAFLAVVGYKNRKNMSYITDEIGKMFDDLKSMVVCRAVEDINEIYKSYQTLEIIKRYLFFTPDINIINFDDIEERENSADYDPSDELLKISESLKERDIQLFNRTFGDITKKMATALRVNNSDNILISVLNIISGYIKKEGLRTEEITERPLYEYFEQLSNINEVEFWLNNVLANAFGILNNDGSNQKRSIIEAAKLYIDKNLAEDISLETVASRIYFSPKYLSKVFKDETGVNFVTYILDRRMEKACDLLKNTDYNVETIAKKTGFRSSAYFIKKFKEKYGITPKEYKKNGETEAKS